MTDEFSRNRSEKLIGLYTAYRTALDATPSGGRYMPYRWWTLPEQMSGVWMIYVEMLKDDATELANIINDLTHHVHRLRAWANVLEGLDQDDQFEAAHEFIDMLGTVALGQPYAVKSRFTFAVGHLSHQANRAKDLKGWKDAFPDKNLYLNDIEPFGKPWRAFRRFKRTLEPLAGSAFKAATDNFRNAYNHGFSSRFVIGFTQSVRREVKDGRLQYALGGSPPLGIAEVADLLEIQRDHCYRTFDKFQALIVEQIDAILACEAEFKRGQNEA